MPQGTPGQMRRAGVISVTTICVTSLARWLQKLLMLKAGSLNRVWVTVLQEWSHKARNLWGKIFRWPKPLNLIGPMKRW